MTSSDASEDAGEDPGAAPTVGPSGASPATPPAEGPERAAAPDLGPDLGPDPSLLLVDDDEAFLRRLGRAMERRGFQVELAGSVAAALEAVDRRPPAYAVVDLRLGDGNGLDVVERIGARRATARVIVLTGYGAIASAVAAVKIGAVDYLPKPADAEEIVQALLARGAERAGDRPGSRPGPPGTLMSADRVRWEHIQRVYEMCAHNVSETARQLGMHRRTLQRILAKRGPR